MALWKPFRGSRTDLDAVPRHDGYVYFCDDGSLHFDYVDANGDLQRKQINAKEAEKLLGYSISTVLNSSDAEIPTSKTVLKAIDDVKDNISTHTHSWNNLSDKPFYGDIIESLVWDGTVEGRDVVTVSYDTRLRYVKISEQYFEPQDLTGGKFVLYVTESNKEAELNITDDLIESAAGLGFVDSASWFVSDGSQPNIFVIRSEEYFEDWGLFTPGVYILASYLEFDPDIVSIYVSKVEFPFHGKTINDRYIPDTIARVSDVSAVNHTHNELEMSSLWVNELFVGDVSIEQLIENIVQKMMDAGRIIEN